MKKHRHKWKSYNFPLVKGRKVRICEKCYELQVIKKKHVK